MKKVSLYPIYIVALLVLLYFDKVANIILSALNYVAAPIKCSGVYLFGIGLAIIIFVESLRYKRNLNKPYRKPQTSDIFPLYNDLPTDKDSYGRDTSAKFLVSKIFSTFKAEKAKKSEGSLVININEAYGYGKTSFLKLLEKELCNSHTGEYYLINYRPWLCDSEKAIIRELFTLLSNTLDNSDIKDEIQDYLHLLLIQSEQIAPTELKPLYIFFHKTLRNKTLQELHDEIKEKLQEIEHPIIITIDDVDRLHEKELVAVLKLIRDTADFPNIFYILAADNTYLEAMLNRLGIEQPHLFLQKFFNLDYLLPAHEKVPAQILKNEMEKILDIYGYNKKEISSTMMKIVHLDYINVIFFNMRDVYRFLNVFTSVLDILRANKNLHLINPYDLFCLTIIRHLTPNIYKILRERNDEFLKINRKGIDTYYIIKKEINSESIKRNIKIEQHIAERQYREDPQNLPKPQKEEPNIEELTLETAIQKTTITYDQIIFFMLDHLFGSPSKPFIDDRSICRCNAYFFYFSGRLESDKLTTAQVIDILKMNSNDYEASMEQLFTEGKSDAFIGNFDYAYPRTGISREEALKKAYIYLKKKFQHTDGIDHQLFNTFEFYINSGYDNFLYFLYGIYGNNHNVFLKKQTKIVEKQLEDFCKTEKDLNMLVLSFYLFSERINNFCFGREYIEKMLDLLGDRLINECMDLDSFTDVTESTFETIYLLKDEFTTNKLWAKKFLDFLSRNSSRCMQWLSNVVDFNDNGSVRWNTRHRYAILGENHMYSEELLNNLKKIFPDCSEAIEELNQLQKYPSLSELDLKEGKFIQKAREIQAAY